MFSVIDRATQCEKRDGASQHPLEKLLTTIGCHSRVRYSVHL